MRIKIFIVVYTIAFFFGLCGTIVSAQVVTTYYENGKKKSEGILKDSVRIGLWQTWYENGQLQDSGVYTLCNTNNTNLLNLTKNYVVEGINTDTDSVSFHRFVDTLILKNILSKKATFQSGQWKYFNEDGTLYEKGNYSSSCLVQIECDEIAEKQVENSDLYVPCTPIDHYRITVYAVKTGWWKSVNRRSGLKCD